MRWLPIVLSAALLVACSKKEEEKSAADLPGEGLVGDGVLNPYPSRLVMEDGHLALPPELFMPVDTPLPVEEMNWRTGFSPSQTAVVLLDDVDDSDFPTWRDPRPGEGSVRMADLTTGEWLPVMAELDAHPDANDEGVQPALLVRPQIGLPYDHDIAVVVMKTAADRPERFEALINGSAPSDLSDHASHFADLMAQLGDLGVDADDVALAWDFPVGEGRTPLQSALDALDLPDAFTWDRVRNLDDGDPMAPSTWRAAEGTFTTQNYLVDDLWLDMQADGSIVQHGEAEVELYVHIPTSVADAPAGSVPIMIFGHGILSRPSEYLDDEEDPSAVIELAEEGGYIVVGSVWRGLTFIDRLDAVLAAGDFGRFPTVTGRLTQAQVNHQLLARMIREGSLLDDDVFLGASGQSLPDPDHLSYYGISLGGISGAVFLAGDPPVDGAVLHVPGAQWSTMLERSSNWTAFEIALVPTIPDPHYRQVLYAGSQLWWDAVDPMSWAWDLRDRSVILQEAVGDEQVPNMTTNALARTMELDVLGPAPDLPWGMKAVDGPLPKGSRALVQLDPEKGFPPEVNRPANVTRAHSIPRLWAGTRDQTIDHLLLGEEGQVVHHCGKDPCSSSNTGD